MECSLRASPGGTGAGCNSEALYFLKSFFGVLVFVSGSGLNFEAEGEGWLRQIIPFTLALVVGSNVGETVLLVKVGSPVCLSSLR